MAPTALRSGRGGSQAIVTAARAASPTSPNPPSLDVVALLGPCLAQDGTADALALAAVLNEGGTGGRWLAFIGEDSSGGQDQAIGTGARS